MDLSFLKRRSALGDSAGAGPNASPAGDPDWDAVIGGCLAGDNEARRILYDRCVLSVYRLVARLVGLQDAEDVTQQVFLHVYQKMDRFEGRSHFKTWLYRVATNEALQFLRKQGRHKTETLGFEPAGNARSVERREQQRELLEKALQGIEPELRSIFLLREKEDLSYREIAGALDIPEGTVGSRLNRARRELRCVLADLGWEG